MEENMLELTTINTTELTNKKLGTQLNTIKKAVDTGNNQQWKIADAIDEESKQCDTPSTYFTILEMLDTLEEAELIALKEYIEKRL